MFGKILKGICVAMGAGLAVGVVASKRRGGGYSSGKPSPEQLPEFKPLFDRLDRIESRIAAVEARPLPVAHTESINDLESRLTSQSEDVRSLRSNINAQQEGISASIEAVERRMADVTTGIPSILQSIVAPVAEDLSHRIAQVEARPLPVSHAESISDLDSKVRAQSEQIQSLRSHISEQEQQTSANMEAVEKRLGDVTTGIPAILESIVAPRTEEFRLRITDLEARPQPVSHADSISDLDFRVHAQSDDIESLRSHIHEQREEISTSIDAVEKRLGNVAAGIPAMLESIIAPRTEELRLRLITEIQQSVRATLTTFERAIEDKVADRITLIEKALLDQSAVVTALSHRAVDLEANVQRMISAVERLGDRLSLSLDARAYPMPKPPAFSDSPLEMKSNEAA
jgi:chromosome segregation ATPase